MVACCQDKSAIDRSFKISSRVKVILKLMNWLYSKNPTSVLLNLRNAVLVVSGIAIVYVFFHLALYTHPSEADDFCFAVQFREMGVWNAIVHNYLFWSGGYTSTFISGVVGAKTNLIQIYKFLPMVMLFATIAAAAFFVASLFRIRLSNPWVWLGGLGYTLFFISIMPAVVSGFYWFNGAVTYQLANIFLMLILAQCVRIIDSGLEGEVGLSSFVILAVLIAIGIGCTETVMAEMVVMVSSICLWRMIFDQRYRTSWLFILLTTICFFLVYALAPGNTQRAAHIIVNETTNHPGWDFPRALGASVYFGFGELETIVASAQLWWATVIFVLLFKAYGNQRAQLKDRIRTSHILFGAIVCFILPFALQFPAQLIIATPPPERAQNAIYFGFLLAWFGVWTLTITKYFNGPIFSNSRSKSSSIAGLVATVMLLLSVGGSDNIQLAYGDLLYRAQDYDLEMKQRYAYVTTPFVEGETIHTIELLQNRPYTISFIDLNFNQSATNKLTCFGRYFGFGLLNIQ